MAVDIVNMAPYNGPVSPALFPLFTSSLIGIGFVFMAWFFVYSATASQKSKSLLKELVLAVLSSSFLGFGTVFLLLWVEIYI